jgi:hypothetical protein
MKDFEEATFSYNKMISSPKRKDYSPKDSLPLNLLEGHEIQSDHRARMVDWMIQVLRVLKVSSD